MIKLKIRLYMYITRSFSIFPNTDKYKPRISAFHKKNITQHVAHSNVWCFVCKQLVFLLVLLNSKCIQE